VSAVRVVLAAAAGAAGSAAHVLAAGADGPSAAIAQAIDPAFLAGAGWVRSALVLFPSAGHPLLGRPVRRVPGCGTTAPRNTRICVSCQRRLAATGIDLATATELPARPDQARGPGGCAVGGCGPERLSGPAQLCRPHHELRERRGVSVPVFTASPAARPLPPLEPCSVPACPRQRRHPRSRYCDSHQQRLRAARKSDPALDEERWRRDATAIGAGGQASFRGLPPLVIAEILAGLQQRCRSDGGQDQGS
jgi:hypothetical protein